MKTLLATAVTLCALAGASHAVAQDSSHGHAPVSDEYAEEFQGFVPGAERLEGRILAPCCWNQTLDIHGSEISNQLKREIRQRLRHGDTPDVIEADLVSRYGEKILAVPKASPLKSLAVVLSAGMGLAGAGAVMMLVRWRRRARNSAGPNPTPPPSSTAKRDELDDRLDQELERDT